MYKDAQRGVKVYAADNFDATEAAIILELWKNNPKHKDLWIVFVTCLQPRGTGLLRFVYPISVTPNACEVPDDVLKHAQQQHQQFGRPPIKGIPEVLRVTKAVIDEIKQCLSPKPSTRAAGRYCDFCSIVVKTPAKVYPARDFVMQTGELSQGSWAACEDCARLIDVQDMSGLAYRIATVSWGLDSAQARQAGRRQAEEIFRHKLE
jgi:hypothetical protein